MFDASAFAGHWPFGLTTLHSVDRVVEDLQSAGFRGAAVSPLDAVFQPDPMPANSSLLDSAHAEADFTLCPVPIIDPTLQTWPEQIDACLDLAAGRVSAIKIVPNYHSYTLDDRRVRALATRLLDRRLGLCVQVRMLDERSHPQAMPVPAVPSASVQELASRFPELPILVCAPYWNELETYRSCTNVMLEVSFAEDGDFIPTLLAKVPAERVMLGTHAPIHAPRPAAAKITTRRVDTSTLALLTRANFARFFGVRSGAEG